MVEVTSPEWSTNCRADLLVGQKHHELLSLSGIVFGRSELDLCFLVIVHGRVVRPAQVELLVRAHVNRFGTNAILRLATAAIGTAGIEGPESGGVLGTACVATRVIQVRQTQVMTELMREHA